MSNSSDADPGAQGGNEHLDLVGGKHLVETGLLHVQNLAFERKDGLVLPVPTLLGRAACRVSLDDEELRKSRVLFLAVGELARERCGVEHSLTTGQLPSLARRFSCARCIQPLLRHFPRDEGVFFEVGAERFVHHGLDDPFDFAVAELRLGLAFELRVRQSHAYDRGQPLAHVLARKGLGPVL